MNMKQPMLAEEIRGSHVKLPAKPGSLLSFPEFNFRLIQALGVWLTNVRSLFGSFI